MTKYHKLKGRVLSQSWRMKLANKASAGSLFSEGREEDVQGLSSRLADDRLRVSSHCLLFMHLHLHMAFSPYTCLPPRFPFL